MFRLLAPALFLLAWVPSLQAQSTALPTATSSLFSGSGNCADCHTSDGTALRDSKGTDLSISTDWRATMMANAAKDPLWQAKVETEVQENPHLQAVIEDKCTTCHAPMGRTQAIFDGASGYTLDEMRASALALDGVSCTVCHQIQPGNLGTDASFSGGYEITDARIIFGPYANVLTMPMQNQVGYTPTLGQHIQGSELCATCHTLFTQFVDDQGQVAGTFPEQVPYLEWQNSVFAQQDVQCQDCHMPRVDENIVIANRPRNLGTQSPFWRHIFIGGNTFMLQILRDNGSEIGVTATTAQFDSTIARTRRQLQQNTARLQVETAVEADQLTIAVLVENLTGHKFPTAYPSRRAWLHVRVTDENGDTVFESGAFDESGRIIPGLQEPYEPHRDVITSAQQVQIYETETADINGNITHVLLRAATYVKDNRLPPKGFTSGAARYPDMAVHGEAENDPNFNRDDAGEGSGTDRVTYLVDVAGQSGKLTVLVELLYQTAKPAFIDHLLSYDTPAVNRFSTYYQSASKTPEIVQSVVTEVDLVTDVRTSQPETRVRGFRLAQNFPNPFNGSTVIAYSLPKAETRVQLRIYDLRGQLVRTLESGPKSAGTHTISWDGTDDLGRGVSSGFYLYRLTAGETSLVRRLLFLK